MTKIQQAIVVFIERYAYESNQVGRPNWIQVRISKNGDDEFDSFDFQFDFKNDEARKAFGALCHQIYTTETGIFDWCIETSRAG